MGRYGTPLYAPREFFRGRQTANTRSILEETSVDRMLFEPVEWLSSRPVSPSLGILQCVYFSYPFDALEQDLKRHVV